MVRKFSDWALPPYPWICRDQTFVDFTGQHVFDDRQGGVVGITASLDEAGFQAGLGHRPANGRPAAVDQDGPHADGLHEDDVEQQVGHRPRLLHHAAAELDDGDLTAELTNPTQGFDKDVGFLTDFFQLRMLRLPMRGAGKAGLGYGCPGNSWPFGGKPNILVYGGGLSMAGAATCSQSLARTDGPAQRGPASSTMKYPWQCR